MLYYDFFDTPGFNPPDLYIEQITELYRNQGWWDGSDKPDLVLRIIHGSHCFMIVHHDQEIVGMGRSISDRTSDAYIQDITVKQNSRGKGIGTHIVRMIINRLQKDGVFWIGLIAEKGSHGFYETIGFKQMINSTPMILSNHEL
jgi:aralkylamine N-acetyltransferase